jgi:hypothetical protein
MLAKEGLLLTSLGRVVERQVCPECGKPMEMVDCRQDCGACYVWYRCSRRCCDGQWLRTIGTGLGHFSRVF